jgi:hypothetical protein
MTPGLLPQLEVQPLERLLHRLVAGEAGPFMVLRPGAHPRQRQIGAGLLQPVGGAVHGGILTGAVRRRAGCGQVAGPTREGGVRNSGEPLLFRRAPVDRDSRWLR